MDEILIQHQGTLYALILDASTLRWNMGVLNGESLPDPWWEMLATDSDGEEYRLCWLSGNYEEGDDGTVDFDIYKPSLILHVED